MGFRTQAEVTKLKLPAGKAEAYFFDDESTGLSVRLQGKARSWVVWYQVSGRRRRMKLGDVAAMPLKEARLQAGSVVNGARLTAADPLANRDVARAKAADTFGALVTTYLARGAKPRQRPRTYAETERYLDRYCDDLHDRPVDAITRRDIAGKLESIRDNHGPGAARKARIYLSGCFVWAMRRGFADTNPVIGTEAPEPERTRDRVLTTAELSAVWHACDGLGDFGAVIRLLMLTGQRRTEVAALSWPEVDIDKALWTLPAERSKNKRQHEVSLSRQALALIRDRQKPFLFGRGGRGAFSGYSRAKGRLDAMLPEGTPAWTLHDLRRSVVTHMAEMGIAPHVIEAVINHVSGHKAGVAGIYNHALYREPKKVALQAWADWLEATVEGRETSANVVALAG